MCTPGKGRKDKAMFGFEKKESFTEQEKEWLLALLEKKIPDLNTADKYFLMFAERYNVTEYVTAIFTVLAKEMHDKAKTDENN
jgi:hypothetical protein